MIDVLAIIWVNPRISLRQDVVLAENLGSILVPAATIVGCDARHTRRSVDCFQHPQAITTLRGTSLNPDLAFKPPGGAWLGL